MVIVGTVVVVVGAVVVVVGTVVVVVGAVVVVVGAVVQWRWLFGGMSGWCRDEGCFRSGRRGGWCGTVCAKWSRENLKEYGN